MQRRQLRDKMTIMMTPKEVLLMIIAILVIVLLIYIIALVRKAIASLAKLDGVLDDAKKITQIASERAEQVDGIMDGIGGAVGQAMNIVKSGKGSIAAATHAIGAGSSFLGLLRRKKKADTMPQEAKTQKKRKLKENDKLQQN